MMFSAFEKAMLFFFLGGIWMTTLLKK